MGTTPPAQRVLLGDGRSHRRLLFTGAHHRCLGSQRALPYSAHRGKKSVNRETLDDLKQQIPLMGDLQAHDWQPARPLSCGRGGNVIRFAELYHQVKFPQALTLLRQWRGAEPLLQEVARFYSMQLHRHNEAIAYLYQRGIRSLELIEHMRIGYAPGCCLRGWLTQLGHSWSALRQADLVTPGLCT